MLSILLAACAASAPVVPAPATIPAPPVPPVEAAAVVAPGPAAVPGALLPPKIYVTLVSHNEEPPNKLCAPVVTDPAAYTANRAVVVEMANAVVSHKAAWDMQNEWTFLEAVRKWDTPELKAKSGDKNLIDFVGNLDPARLSVDAHSHERSYNYADVQGLIAALGAPRNGVVGGFIYSPSTSQVWTRLRNELPGVQNAAARFTAEILWGAATFQHGGPDMRVSGIWRPKDGDNFTQDDPSQKLVYIGSYQYGFNHDFTGVKELIDRLHKGELEAGHLYTASVFFHQCDLTSEAIGSIMAEVDALAPEVAAGNLVWSPLTHTVRTWWDEYHALPTMLTPLAEGPAGPGGGPGMRGEGGPRGPRGPGGGMGQGGGRLPGGAGLKGGGAEGGRRGAAGQQKGAD